MRRNHVLIIEDDESVREALSLLLECGGYDVAAASNGAEALSLLADAEPPCLILCDLMMPVMDGWTFANEVEKDPRLAFIPIVFVTAFAEKASSLKALAVMRKPIDTDRLLELVRRHCGDGG